MTQRGTGCAFCAVVARDEPVLELLRTDNVVAFFPDEPATLGHTLVVPRAHIPDVWSLDEPTSRHLTVATLIVARAVRDALAPAGLNIIQSNGEAATQSVFHLHVHLVPRYTNDDMGPIWPDATDLTASQKQEALDNIRRHLPKDAK